MYADVEQILISWLAARFPSVRFCTELPATLPSQVVQVVRFGGGRSAIPFDDASVDVDCYAANRADAHSLAEQVAHALSFDLPGYRSSGGAIVLSAECLTAPSWAPYDNTSVRRISAAFQVRTHNPI